MSWLQHGRDLWRHSVQGLPVTVHQCIIQFLTLFHELLVGLSHIQLWCWVCRRKGQSQAGWKNHLEGALSCLRASKMEIIVIWTMWQQPVSPSSLQICLRFSVLLRFKMWVWKTFKLMNPKTKPMSDEMPGHMNWGPSSVSFRNHKHTFSRCGGIPIASLLGSGGRWIMSNFACTEILRMSLKTRNRFWVLRWSAVQVNLKPIVPQPGDYRNALPCWTWKMLTKRSPQ